MIKKIIAFVILISSMSNYSLAQKDTLYLSVASSLYNVSKSLTEEWKRKNNTDVVIITGPTSLIARQIYNGQTSDIIISANRDWLLWMNNKELINIEEASLIAKNSLIFSSGINKGFYVDINSKNFKEDFINQLSSSMFPIPHPSTVPLGIYAKEALKSMELWSLLEGKLVYTASSQSNLKFISNGDALVGISYLSDAVSSPNILIVAKIDEKIFRFEKPTYLAAKINRNKNNNDYGFINWLKSKEAQRIIKNYGFETIN